VSPAPKTPTDTPEVELGLRRIAPVPQFPLWIPAHCVGRGRGLVLQALSHGPYHKLPSLLALVYRVAQYRPPLVAHWCLVWVLLRPCRVGRPIIRMLQF